MEYTEYMETLKEQIQNKRARSLVAEEIRGHIEEQAKEYQAEGMSKEDAEREAVRQMGDPMETGCALNRIHRPAFPWKLFVLAVLLKKKLPGSNVFKAIYFMPIAMATSIITAIFRIIMDPTNGALNQFLRAIHLNGFAVNWLGDPKIALVSVIIVNIFQWMGFSMITYYAGLMSLPDDVYEAAKIDGAGFWRTTFSVTLPMLKGTTNVLIILGIVGSLKTFDIVKLLTGGGPGRSTTVMNTYLYEKAFKDFNAGGAASIGVAILIIAMVMSFLQVKFGKED